MENKLTFVHIIFLLCGMMAGAAIMWACAQPPPKDNIQEQIDEIRTHQVTQDIEILNALREAMEGKELDEEFIDVWISYHETLLKYNVHGNTN